MALPVILVDSATGSDTQASGAGPSTALFGTTDASFATATVTLTAGTDLTNVATDGSHVLYLLTSTGVRFFKITAKAGSGGATPTVDVTPNPAGTSTGRTWAIGGKRASLFSSSSLLLVDNGGAAGDAKPGWIVEFQSGHSEIMSSRVDVRCSGDTTTGPIIIRGELSAATMPKLRFQAASAAAFVNVGSYVNLGGLNYGIEFSAEASVTNGVSFFSRIQDCRFARTSSNTFGSYAVKCSQVLNCDLGYAIIGVDEVGDDSLVSGNYIHDMSSHGINIVSSLGPEVIYNVIVGAGGDGIRTDFNGAGNRSLSIIGNTIDSCTSDGIELTSAMSDGLLGLRIMNNIITNNGGYDIKFSDGSATLIGIQTRGAVILNNNSYGNTSGNTGSPSGISSTGNPGLDPTYTGGGNYTPTNASLAGTAYPTSIP